ncbi:T9SS type A sorting domain-containing protein [Flavobacterium branchiicola]|uniref:T9SS type A sorting domain-containing protein n=1 Tax=Flavobacterium branchiicola TaxID=1114875 RepID=A0ABV9PF07_9FLAO|nr:T9SS type A sorting domain-containing protein [Flavobacterium branchiicola]MBS7253802.1 T9SS type A sorting domain-containing protein [Flavobacterium branchiicola]
MIKNYLLLLTLCIFSSVNSQIISFTDANFKTKLLQANANNTTAKNLSSNYFTIDSNSNGEIETDEALNVTYLDLKNFNITSLDELKNFTNLKQLDCSTNNLNSLDLTGLNKLERLNCSFNSISLLNLSDLNKISSLVCHNNKLTSLNLLNLTSLAIFEGNNNNLSSLDLSNSLILQELVCYKNELTELKLPNSVYLWFLKCAENLLTTLDIAKLDGLRYFDFWNNKIETIDFSNSKKLTDCYGGINPLTSVDLSNSELLKALWIGHTAIKTLDISNLKNLKDVNISDCPNLEFLNIKNGTTKNFDFLESALTSLGYNGQNLSNCPNLQYICDEESNLTFVTEKIASYQYTNCLVGNYCSFEPGGVSYTFQGKNQIDIDNNGCDAADIGIPYLNFSILNGSKRENFSADANGAYSFKLLEGSYKIVPVIENENYFTISPASVDIVFPAQISPLNQDFCIVPNGLHNDLEVNILPIEDARPGFDVKYKIIFKNKGTVTQSGKINLVFDGSVLDLIATSLPISNQTPNNLIWDFSNLKPYESKEIAITFNVNAPTETPAVNIDDVLKYNVALILSETDETPLDNTFEFNQKVVGSYDPNDKTCLEGNVIKPELIGQYVHYMIRFENTGNYPAENIVVKDLIDLSKFDISTLVPTSSSHSFATKISDGNKVEFIFENINLPYDDANNDGYIAFKIKTLPTLKVGDSFTNEANIYFDYNFPILTNNATSTFKTLSVQDFQFSDYLGIHPNPVKGILNVDSKNEIEKQAMYVYDILGQLIIAVPDATNTSKIDVSKLKTGNYILKVKTNKGISNIKFIKK